MLEGGLLSLSLNSFLDRLASEEPTPGGGSVAALVAALAAGLGEMSCAYTLGRPKFAAVELQVRDITTHLKRAGQMLRCLIDEDSEAYADLSAAFAMDKSAPDRRMRIQDASSVAAGVPFQTAALSRQVHSDLRRLLDLANPRLKSDVEAGVCLADAAFKAAVANVRINLPFMRPTDAARMEQELVHLLADEYLPA
ncbi:MAG: cyclodeaminase/cyclohydrolase family protein [Phycisphaerae bacterium]|nr:cyclodeaminase/cyclohydrolase family protein [Phycisphaerae bacterium]